MSYGLFKKLVSMVLLILLLTGCGIDTHKPGKAKDVNSLFKYGIDAPAAKGPQKGKLIFWTIQQDDINIEVKQKAAVKKFEEENNCIIEIVSFPYALLQDKMLLAVANGKGPDLLLIDQIWMPQYAASGFVSPIDLVLRGSSIDSNDFFSGAWATCKYQGKTYALPFDIGVISVLYYNKSLFKEAGLDPENPPQTWSEFINIGKQLTRNGKYGTAAYIGQELIQCQIDSFIFSAGGKIVDNTSRKALLNSEAGIKSLEFWKACAQISPQGSVGRNEEDAFKLFLTGKVAMIMYGQWGQDIINARARQMDYGIALQPRPESGRSIGILGGWNIGINSNCADKKLAWRFLQFATGRDNQMNITMLIPANKEAAREYLKENYIFPDLIYQQMSSALFRPLVPNYTEVASIQRNAVKKVLLNLASSRDALDEAAQKINEQLNK